MAADGKKEGTAGQRKRLSSDQGAEWSSRGRRVGCGWGRSPHARNVRESDGEGTRRRRSLPSEGLKVS